MGVKVRLDTPARPREAVLLRRAPGDQWLAAPKEGAPCVRLGVRQRAGRWTPRSGTRRQRAGLSRLRLRQWPGGACTSARWARVDHDDRPARRGQRDWRRTRQAPGGFQHHEGRVLGVPPFHAHRDALRLVGDRPARSSGTQGNVSRGLGHLDTDKAGWITPWHSGLPALAETGSMAPDNWTGLRRPGRDDPCSAPVSVDPG